jgi:hypothetical protein
MKPLAVFVIAVLYMAVGLVGFVSHFSRHWQPEDVLIEVTEVLAITCGVFLVRGKNWARWLALAWMLLHVIISLPVISQTAIHLSFLIVIAVALFRPGMRRYFITRRHGS